ncbi:MAG: hypothetical protein EAX86_10965 [Candidatus Heimdallarchaeota archaeon]|nr:hypothetical protein [Candidatus Heimdallarchaeota archaeon]
MSELELKDLIGKLEEDGSVTNFIQDFMNYWSKIRHGASINGNVTGWKDWDQTMRELLPITEELHTKWKNIFKRIDGYIDTFSSILLELKGGSILFPKQIIFFESVREEDLLAQLKANPTLETLEMVLLSLSSGFNLKLRKNDLRIVQKIANPRFSKSLDHFPKHKELAYFIRSDVRTVSSSLSYLIQNNILSTIYLIDTARIGYKTSVFYHLKLDQEKSIYPHIILSFPLSTDRKLNATVVQYPYRGTKKYSELRTFFNTDQIQLNKEYRGWNFATLTSYPSNRWNYRPPLIQPGGSWTKRVLSSNDGITFDLNPEFDPYELTYREARILAYISKYGTFSETDLSKQLKVTRSYITSDWKALLRRKIISRFPIFSNLGLDSWFYISIRNLTLNSILTMEDIIQHLKFFPYCNLIYNDKKGDLLGLICLPSKWVSSFIFQLCYLPKIVPGCAFNYYIGPDIHNPWGFDIEGTYNWELSKSY